jgi:hypothetical protein
MWQRFGNGWRRERTSIYFPSDTLFVVTSILLPKLRHYPTFGLIDAGDKRD